MRKKWIVWGEAQKEGYYLQCLEQKRYYLQKWKGRNGWKRWRK